MNEVSDHPFLQLIRQRCSVESFDTAREIPEATVRELVADASCAPSSFNIQHWRFVAVRSRAGREKLLDAAFGQEQVLQAPVTFIVLGDLRGTERLPEIMRAAVARDAIAQGKADAWVRMAGQIYENESMARDEAIRSASLASMILMLAAEARGLASGALSGFSVEKVRRHFNIAKRYLPVVLLTVGYPRKQSESRMPRLDIDDVLVFDSGDDL